MVIYIIHFEVRKKKKKGEKHILVPTFSDDSHFSSYILFLPLLVPILKTLFVLVPIVTSEMEKVDMANGKNK